VKGEVMEGDGVYCPKRGNLMVSLEVCLTACDTMEDCNELKLIPQSQIDEAKGKIMPVPTEVVEVGVEALSADDAGKKNDEPAQLLHKAVAIKTEIEGKFWEMGSILHVIFNRQYYVDYGYHDWKDFCNDVLEMKWRTATYLRDIYVKFTSLGCKAEDCVGVGWAKLKELLPVVNKSNVKYWLQEAKKKNVSIAVLNAKVRVALGKMTPEEAEKLPQSLSFRLYEEQSESVERALDLARRMTGSDSRGYQLEMICAEFRATYESAEENFPKNKTVKDLVEKISALLKVDFVGKVVDGETGDVILKTA
jgi:hypothetical protein